MKLIKTKGIILIIGTTLLASLGQVLLKIGSTQTTGFNINMFLNFYFWAGFAAYGLGMLMLLAAIKEEELSSLFPVLSLSFIWVMIFSYYLFNEPLTNGKLAGTLLITMGVAIITKHNYKKIGEKR